MKNNNFAGRKSQRYFVGRQIRAAKVLCIDNENINRGVIPIKDALQIAESNGLDLVQISDKDEIPTCKILNYSKFKFDLSKKEKESRKKQRESIIKIKEIKFRPATDENDLKIKARQAREFLEEGHKVKITIMFKGRELAYKDVGLATFNKFLELVPAQSANPPLLNGRQLTAIISMDMLKAS